MSVFESKNYVDFVKQTIYIGKKKKRGIIKTLAERLRCHPTFISQVIAGKAHFSHDQAVKFCLYLQIEQDEKEFFIDQLNRDRAASTEAKLHFQQILDRKLLDRRTLHNRSNIRSNLRVEQEIQYFSKWSTPVIHAAIQIPGFQTVDKLAKIIGLSIPETEEILKELEVLNLAKKDKNNWVPTKNIIHIGKDSPLTSNFHSNWRVKTASRLMTGRRNLNQTHFSSVFAISKDVAEEIRELLLKNMEDVRKRMVSAPSEILYSFCVDFYPLS